MDQNNRKQLDPDTLKIPAYMRNKAIVTMSRQKLLWTAWDRKAAGVPYNSTKATAPVKISKTTAIKSTQTRAIPRATAFSSPEDISAPVSAPEFNPKFNQKLKSVGKITHYLEKINVAIIKLTAKISQGQTLIIEGDDYLFFQEIDEMQIDRKSVATAKKGDHIGLKVNSPAVVNGSIYLLK